jgi:hypothetical protein
MDGGLKLKLLMTALALAYAAVCFAVAAGVMVI